RGRVERLEEGATPEGAGNQLVAAVAVEVAGGKRDAAGKPSAIGEEVTKRAGAQRGDRAFVDKEGPNLPRRALARGDGDLGLAVVVEAPGGHETPAGDARVEGDEACEQGRIRDLPVGKELVRPGAVHDLDVRLGPRPGPADVVRNAVAVDVANADANAALEGGVEGEEVGHDFARTLEYLDVGRPLIDADNGQRGRDFAALEGLQGRTKGLPARTRSRTGMAIAQQTFL